MLSLLLSALMLHKTTRLLLVAAAIHLLPSCSQGSGSPQLLNPELNSINQIDDSQEVQSINSSTALTRHTVQLGPFELKANTTANVMRFNPGRLIFSVDEALWITKVETQLKDVSQKNLPSSLLHLALFSNRGEQNTLCQGKQTANPFAASTSNLQKINLPDGYGYPVLPSDELEIKVILRNPTDEDFDNVFFKVVIEGIPLSSGERLKDVAALLLENEPCTHMPLSIEPGSMLNHEQRFAMPEDGKLVAAYGLLQDYGVEIALTKDGNEGTFWQAFASLNSDHQVMSLPSYQDKAGIDFKAGEGIVVASTYHNDSTEWIEAPTAAMVYVARGDGEISALNFQNPANNKHAEKAINVQSLLIR